jgi:hypothetical protein
MKISSKLLSLLAILSFTTIFLSSCSEDPLPAVTKSKIRVVHAAADAPAVNVNVDNVTAITALNYKSASVYAEVNSGERDIRVIAPSLSNAEVFGQKLTLAENVNYSVFAVGPVTAGKVSVILSTDMNTPVAGKAKIRFAHMSPDAPIVDIRTADGTPLFANAGTKTVSNYIEVDPGTVSLKVTTQGGATTLFEFEPVTLAAGQVYTAVAMGTVDATDAIPVSVRVFVDTDQGNTFVDLVPKASQAQTAEIMLVHASPDAPAVDVLVNGTKVTTSPLAFPNSLGYLTVDISNGNPTIALNVPALNYTVPVPANVLPTLAAGEKYTIFVVGELQKQTMSFIAVLDTFYVNPELPTIRFAHLSPDAPNVDILLTIPGMPDYPVPTMQNIAYKEISRFVHGQAGTFPIKVKVTGTETIALTVPSFTFTNGKVITIFANGLAGGTPALSAGVINHN